MRIRGVPRRSSAGAALRGTGRLAESNYCAGGMARVQQGRKLAGDAGSVTPLVLGMMVCLLVLTAGVTAAGSAFLAGQRLQRLCDGAVAAAVGAVDPSRQSSEGIGLSDPIAAANEYLRVRGPDVGAVVSLGVDRVSAQCSNEAPITFGALFGFPTIPRTATATSQPIRKLNASGGPDVFEQARVQAGPEGTLI